MGAPEGKEGEIHAELLRRAIAYSDRLVRATVAVSILVSLALLAFIMLAWRGIGIVSGVMLGIWGFVWFSFALIGCLSAGYVMRRRIVARRVRAWCDEAAAAHHLAPDSFDYLTAMFEKAKATREFGPTPRR